ncbi:hypothetical protein AB0E67_36235 [Streptomyces sp. NPDC032161]|uniref:hypothetical protein n=1 Tax=unclassified Streptomyces TaxID=2593676 RepID=UPI0033D90D43
MSASTSYWQQANDLFVSELERDARAALVPDRSTVFSSFGQWQMAASQLGPTYWPCG